ncbi:transposase [Paraburkholderia youngii]|uniref:transposase n=1 Tax=Paraburkholderia youngii TaxID=2782701 RepID=UPI0020CD8253|nr:transposase [Paraburkholderia youngii]
MRTRISVVGIDFDAYRDWCRRNGGALGQMPPPVLAGRLRCRIVFLWRARIMGRISAQPYQKCLVLLSVALVRATGQRFGCNMISAISNRGMLSFMVFEGTFKNATFIEFMKRLLKQATRKIYLIVDGHPVHRSVAVRRFVADNAERLRLRLIRLPGYCPELNPDELLNQDVKTNAPGKSRPTSKAGNDRQRPSTPAPLAKGASRDSQPVQRKAC